jgi:hypothetical protein
MHRSEFLRLVKNALPELRHAINQEEGLLHFEVRVLRMRAQQAISDGDREVLGVCFRLAEQAYQAGDEKLKAAIDQSFVEDLEFGTKENPIIWAWEMMPAQLRSLYEQFLHRRIIVRALQSERRT